MGSCTGARASITDVLPTSNNPPPSAFAAPLIHPVASTPHSMAWDRPQAQGLPARAPPGTHRGRSPRGDKTGSMRPDRRRRAQRAACAGVGALRPPAEARTPRMLPVRAVGVWGTAPPKGPVRAPPEARRGAGGIGLGSWQGVGDRTLLEVGVQLGPEPLNMIARDLCLDARNGGSSSGHASPTLPACNVSRRVVWTAPAHSGSRTPTSRPASGTRSHAGADWLPCEGATVDTDRTQGPQQA